MYRDGVRVYWRIMGTSASATTQADTDADPGGKHRVPRVKAENRYPGYDLTSSLEAAKVVKEKGGNACTPEQLGAFLGYRNTAGGGFAARVASAKAFGLIRTERNHYEATARAEAALYPITPESRAEALRDAFLGVPIYRRIYDRFRGTQLPQEVGMKNLLHTEFGLPAGDRLTVAYRVMMDSAETAGFFSVNGGQRTHLIEPLINGRRDEGTPRPPAAPPRDTPVDDPGEQGRRVRHHLQVESDLHPALQGLLSQLPPPPRFPRRKQWEAAWAATLDFVYTDEEDNA